jgi:hypothetical protein
MVGDLLASQWRYRRDQGTTLERLNDTLVCDLKSRMSNHACGSYAMFVKVVEEKEKKQTANIQR